MADTAQTLTGKTLTSPVLTTPQINDTSADHQYVFAVSELAADRTVTLPLLTGADEFVFKDHTQTMTNKTLTSPTLTTPKIATTGAITDAGGDEYLKFVEGTTPVNEITITSANTGAAPRISATGGNDNINLELMGKGTGNVTFVDAATPTKAVAISAVGITATKTATLTFGNSLDATITFPTATATLATVGGTENLTGKTLTSPKIDDGDADVTITSADQTNASATVTIPNIGDAADTFVMNDTAATLTNKTLTTPILSDGDAGCTITSADQTNASATITIPDCGDAADEFVLKDTAQTLTNKTLTAPVETNPALSFTIGAHDYGAGHADWTLSAGEALYMVHKPTNADAGANAIIPTATSRPYIFINGSGQIITVKTAAGTGIAIANGKTHIVMSDGTNVIALAAVSA